MQKLPARSLIVHAHLFVERKWRTILRIVLVPWGIVVLISAGIEFALPFPSEDADSSVLPWARSAVGVATLILTATMTAALLRLVVFGKGPQRGFFSALRLGRSEYVLILLTVALQLASVAAVGTVALCAWLLMRRFPTEGVMSLSWMSVALSLLVVNYCWLRLAFAWPIAAAHALLGASESWRLLGGNVFRLFVVFFGVTILPLLTQVLLQVLGVLFGVQLLAAFLCVPFAALAFVLLMVALGLAYLVATGAVDMPDETEPVPAAA